MSGVASASGARNAWLTGAAWRALFRDRPMIPLLFLLAILVVVSELARPGIVGPEWIGVILRAAVLLAILAGCQTLTMLTGGIDLSVGAVGSMAGFVVASFAAGAGWPTGVVVALIAAALAGFLYSGYTNVASVTLVDSAVLPSVAAAVIGGTSILGGRGGYGGTIVGALILTVVSSLLSSLGYPEAVRQVLFGAIIVAVAAAYTRVTGET